MILILFLISFLNDKLLPDNILEKAKSIFNGKKPSEPKYGVIDIEIRTISQFNILIYQDSFLDYPIYDFDEKYFHVELKDKVLYITQKAKPTIVPNCLIFCSKINRIKMIGKSEVRVNNKNKNKLSIYKIELNNASKLTVNNDKVVFIDAYVSSGSSL